MKQICFLFLLITIGCDSIEKDKIKEENETLKKKLVELEVLSEQQANFEVISVRLIDEINQKILKINKERFDLTKSSFELENSTDVTFVGIGQNILTQLEVINYYIDDAYTKIDSLERLIPAIRKSNSSSNKFITSLKQVIYQQDQEIIYLKKKVDEQFQKIVNLQTEVESKEKIIRLQEEIITQKIKTKYFKYGPSEYLEKIGLIKSVGGFLGIGSHLEPSDSFTSFTDYDEVSYSNETIKYYGTFEEILPKRNTSIYKIDSERNTLIIYDLKKFWEVSSYLIIVTE